MAGLLPPNLFQRSRRNGVRKNGVRNCVRIDDVGSILKFRIDFPFGENSAGICRSVWLPGSILNFRIRSVSSIGGVDCRDPVCRHRFRFPDFFAISLRKTNNMLPKTRCSEPIFGPRPRGQLHWMGSIANNSEAIVVSEAFKTRRSNESKTV